LTFLDDSRAENIEDRNGISSEEKNQEARQYMVNKLINLLIKENIGTDRARQAYVLENYFGVNGRKKLTLEQISAQIGVTKERVRQLKEKGLQWIRQKVNDLNLNMEDASYF
jgi:RNA polymerase primary sigma factor